MQITIRNINSEDIKVISLKESDSLQKIFEKSKEVKGPLEVNIFLINEKLHISQIAKFKSLIEKLNIKSFSIFSNKREVILAGKSLKIDSIFTAETDMKSRLFFANKKKSTDILHKGTVRSGDRISSNSDLCIIGDVNPGAIVSAKKNVYVWGKLLGIALAGEGGNKDAIIASLYLKPLQLRIADVIAIGPKEKPNNFYPEIALLDKQNIIIKPFLIDS